VACEWQMFSSEAQDQLDATVGPSGVTDDPADHAGAEVSNNDDADEADPAGNSYGGDKRAGARAGKERTSHRYRAAG
jgi:hypothetical protein